ncbi:MAG: hypothetical protein LBF33_00375 [Oscillospiraceae bacterium]|jgi:hypothetical protein|nr:hypothetical protein [Oscillospiraceae bacterium]
MITKSFILKARLFENGINISKNAKKFLNSKSSTWFMDNHYITCTGILMHFEDQYITVISIWRSKYSFKCRNAELFISVKLKSEQICEKYGIRMGPLCKPCSHNTL